MVFDVFPYIVLVHVFVISNDDWRNGNKIKLKFLLSLRPKETIPYDMTRCEMMAFPPGEIAKSCRWHFPPRAYAQRNFNRKGERARSQNIKASVRKICFCGFLHSQSFPDLLYCDVVHYHASVCQLSQFHIQNGEFSMNARQIKKEDKNRWLSLLVP